MGYMFLGNMYVGAGSIFMNKGKVQYILKAETIYVRVLLVHL